MTATETTPPPSPARLAANRRNAQQSTGPRTEAGKLRSRANAVKHGLTGAGVALPVEDRATIDARFAAIRAELAPQTTLGVILAEQVAIMSIRMERSVVQEAAALAGRVRVAEAEFDRAHAAELARPAADRPPADPAAVASARAEAGLRALFDPGREATLARRYEAAAGRAFYRALRELRAVEADAAAAAAAGMAPPPLTPPPPRPAPASTRPAPAPVPPAPPASALLATPPPGPALGSFGTLPAGAWIEPPAELAVAASRPGRPRLDRLDRRKRR